MAGLVECGEMREMGVLELVRRLLVEVGRIRSQDEEAHGEAVELHGRMLVMQR